MKKVFQEKKKKEPKKPPKTSTQNQNTHKLPQEQTKKPHITKSSSLKNFPWLKILQA